MLNLSEEPMRYVEMLCVDCSLNGSHEQRGNLSLGTNDKAEIVLTAHESYSGANTQRFCITTKIAWPVPNYPLPSRLTQIWLFGFLVKLMVSSSFYGFVLVIHFTIVAAFDAVTSHHERSSYMDRWFHTTEYHIMSTGEFRVPW